MRFWPYFVTTCVVVWIEIQKKTFDYFRFQVTTCVVVWIEICKVFMNVPVGSSHHLRGGVD